MAAVLASVLKDSAHNADALLAMDCSLCAYYSHQLWAIGDELRCDAPNIEDVMAAHPRVSAQEVVQAA